MNNSNNNKLTQEQLIEKYTNHRKELRLKFDEKKEVHVILTEQKRKWIEDKISIPLDERIAAESKLRQIRSEIEKIKDKIDLLQGEHPEFDLATIGSEQDIRSRLLQSEYWKVTKAILISRGMIDLLQDIREISRDRVDNRKTDGPVEDLKADTTYNMGNVEKSYLSRII